MKTVPLIFVLFGLLLVLVPLVRGEDYFSWPENRSDIFDPQRWSYKAGVAVITSNTIDQLARGNFNRAAGPAGGEIYLFGVSYTLLDPEFSFCGRTYRPQMEAVAVGGWVDEQGKRPFYDANVGVTFRWKDFPWNDAIYTNFETGVGFSYTQKVMQIERDRHPGRQRSHLKFYWPIELYLAHPRYRQHQAFLFIHHQSGGRTFDQGGSNHVGIGYRYVFRER